MTSNQIIEAVDHILDNSEIKKELGITKHDKQNFQKRRSIPKMLELLWKADKLKLIDGSSSNTSKTK